MLLGHRLVPGAMTAYFLQLAYFLSCIFFTGCHYQHLVFRSLRFLKHYFWDLKLPKSLKILEDQSWDSEVSKRLFLGLGNSLEFNFKKLSPGPRDSQELNRYKKYKENTRHIILKYLNLALTKFSLLFLGGKFYKVSKTGT